MKYFYAKYVSLELLVGQLHEMDLSDTERRHLAALVDLSLHHRILDEILSNLSESDKKIFLNKLREDPESEDLIEFLNEKIEGIDGKIKKAAQQLIKEMHEDVKEAKKLK